MAPKETNQKAEIKSTQKPAAPNKGPNPEPKKQKETPKTPTKGCEKTETAKTKTKISANNKQKRPNKSEKTNRKAKKKVTVFDPHPLYQYEPIRKRRFSFSSFLLVVFIVSLLAYLFCAPVYSFCYRDVDSGTITTETNAPMYRLAIRAITDIWRPEDQRIIDFSLGPLPEANK